MVCLNNEGYEASLEKRKLYFALADDEAAKHKLVRVIDESGEDYLYPCSFFPLSNYRRTSGAPSFKRPDIAVNRLSSSPEPKRDTRPARYLLAPFLNKVPRLG